MNYKNVQEWLDEYGIRVIRYGQHNYFVERDVAHSINESTLLHTDLRLSDSDFVRLPVNGEITTCLPASTLLKLDALSKKPSINGGMLLDELNSESIVNTLSEPTEEDRSIEKALEPHLASLVSPDDAVLVTPELAKILLGGNLKNRPKNNRNFKRLCSQLRAGKWKLNGATITISWNCKLLDGQHRLFAIVETGIAAPCILGFGFAPNVFATLDQGAKRTNADNLSLMGFANTRLLAATIGVYQAAKAGNAITAATRRIDPEECLDIAVATPHIQGAVKRAKHYYHQGARFVPVSHIGGLMARAMEINSLAATKFFDFLLNDSCNGTRPPVIQKLRSKLLRLYMDKDTPTNAAHIAALIIKVWNAFRKGESIRNLKFVMADAASGSADGEPYPIMT